jgi:hypothetical protein
MCRLRLLVGERVADVVWKKGYLFQRMKLSRLGRGTDRFHELGRGQVIDERDRSVQKPSHRRPSRLSNLRQTPLMDSAVLIPSAEQLALRHSRYGDEDSVAVGSPWVAQSGPNAPESVVAQDVQDADVEGRFLD